VCRKELTAAIFRSASGSIERAGTPTRAAAETSPAHDRNDSWLADEAELTARRARQALRRERRPRYANAGAHFAAVLTMTCGGTTVADKRHVYGEVENKTDLREVFTAIRGDVDQARSREALTELYRRAGYLITLTHAPSWKEKFGDEADDLREAAADEFARTARAINRRAGTIGTDADYDETWGE